MRPFDGLWPASRPSRFIWLFVGAAGATYLIKRQVWAAKLAELKEKKDLMVERGRQEWDERKERVLSRGRQTGDKLAELSEASLDKVSTTVEAMKAQREERDKQRLEKQNETSTDDALDGVLTAVETIRAKRAERRTEGAEVGNTRTDGALDKVWSKANALKMKRAERREKRDEHANSQSDRDTEDLDS